MLLADDAQMNIIGYFYEIPCLHQDHVTASLRLTATRVNDTKYLLIFLKVKCLFSVMTWRLASGADRAEAGNVSKKMYHRNPECRNNKLSGNLFLIKFRVPSYPILACHAPRPGIQS